MKVKPLKNHLLVQLEKNNEVTKGGIFLTGNAHGDSNLVKVIETSDYIDEDQTIFVRGDKLLVGPSAGVAVMLDGIEYHIISFEDVLGVLSY